MIFKVVYTRARWHKFNCLKMAGQTGKPARIGRVLKILIQKLMADHLCLRDQLEIHMIGYWRIPDIGINRITNGGKQNTKHQ